MIRNIWAVGRNYADHAKELNNPLPHEPLIFLKAGTTANLSSRIRLPTWSHDIHHEVELALLLDDNLNFTHVTLALDLTARDKQAEAKQKGSPWTTSKSFTGATPLGEWVPLTPNLPMSDLNFNFEVNGQIRQTGHAGDMLFSPDRVLSFILNFFPVVGGDVLLTGTPAGVGPLKTEDLLKARLFNGNEKILTCQWEVE